MQPFQLARSACDDYRRFVQTTYPILDDELRQLWNILKEAI